MGFVVGESAVEANPFCQSPVLAFVSAMFLLLSVCSVALFSFSNIIFGIYIFLLY